MYSSLKELSDNNITPKQASSLLGIKYNTLLKHWKRQNLPLQGSGGLNRLISTNPFEIWNEVAQYWFGYILGDGNVSKRKYNIAIYSQDLDHLQKYADWLGLKIHISNNAKKGTVLFGHSATHKWLIERGITPNKSLTAELQIPFTRHILRGLFDADGCGRRLGNPNKITSGSLPLLEQVQDYLKMRGIDTVIHLQCGRTYCIHIRRASDEKFFKLLYSNSSIFMQRKFDRVYRSANKIG